jgi:hypothetical protein
VRRVLQNLNRHTAVSGSVRCYPGGESLNAPRVAKLTQHVVVSGSVRCYPGDESLNAPRVAKLTQHVVVSGGCKAYTTRGCIWLSPVLSWR